MTWFERLTGATEESPAAVRSQVAVDGNELICPNGKRLIHGSLETPTLGELRERVASSDCCQGTLTVSERVADVRQLHMDDSNAGAMFQVASQFNLLEMARPSHTPELGVGIYERDHTQGPACAISCGAGTIYRNYFAPVGKRTGQSAQYQIDCSLDLGDLLGNQSGQLWEMQNGYLFPTDPGLTRIATAIQMADDAQLDAYRSSVRIGLQWDTEVTTSPSSQLVSQSYCSALPVAYGRQAEEAWADFAKLVLDAAYEATICAAILNRARTESSKLYLTLLGGGVFGNRDQWIMDAIQRAARAYNEYDLQVQIVSYGTSRACIRQLCKELAE